MSQLSKYYNKIEVKDLGLILCETPTIKTCKSSHYNVYFRKDTGFTARWSQTLDDDPQLSPAGPEIADIEISTAEQ